MAAVALALVIIGAIGNAAQSCSSSATPSTDSAAETTGLTTAAPTTTGPTTAAPTTTPAPTPVPAPAATPLINYPSGGESTPQLPVNPDGDASKDVTLLDCSWKTDTYNMTTATANVRVVNHTATAQFYSINVGLSDAQGQSVATAYALAESVPPGATVTVAGTGDPSGPVPGMRCKVTDVLRVPASAGGTGAGGASHLDLPHVGVPHVGVPHVDLDLPHLHFGHGGHGHN